MLLGLAILLALFWIAGLSFHILGGFIHIVLVVAVIVAILHFVFGKRKAV